MDPNTKKYEEVTYTVLRIGKKAIGSVSLSKDWEVIPDSRKRDAFVIRKIDRDAPQQPDSTRDDEDTKPERTLHFTDRKRHRKEVDEVEQAWNARKGGRTGKRNQKQTVSAWNWHLPTRDENQPSTSAGRRDRMERPQPKPEVRYVRYQPDHPNVKMEPESDSDD